MTHSGLIEYYKNTDLLITGATLLQYAYTTSLLLKGSLHTTTYIVCINDYTYKSYVTTLPIML